MVYIMLNVKTRWQLVNPELSSKWSLKQFVLCVWVCAVWRG